MEEEGSFVRRYKDYNKGVKSDPKFKQTVILCAEQNGNRAASEKYGVPYSTLRRWRRFREDIFGDDDEYIPYKGSNKWAKLNKAKIEARALMKRVFRQSSATRIKTEQHNSDDEESMQDKLSGPSSPKPQSRPSTPKPDKTPQNHLIPAASTSKRPPPREQDSAQDPEEVCLRWNSHHNNMKSSFPSLLEKEQYVDVTLCSEGQTIRCHRLILSSCSAYFEEILSTITPLQHPVIFLKGTPFWVLKSLIDFMYVGEVHIENSKLQEILEVAEALKIKGLTGKSSTNNNSKSGVKEEPKSQSPPPPPPPPVQHKRAVPPLRLAISKEQAAAMQLDNSSLLKPTFYEETATSSKTPTLQQYRTILPKSAPGAILTQLPRKEMWLKKLAPKKKLKRKSTERDLSPPPVLRKGTKSRPIVRGPKYYHMEFDNDAKIPKSEDENTTEEHKSETKSPVSEPPSLEPFDISNVKCEPLDIEENDLYQEPFAPSGTIRFNSGIEEPLPKPDANENIASKPDPLRVNDEEAVNGEENEVIDVGTNTKEKIPDSNDT